MRVPLAIGLLVVGCAPWLGCASAALSESDANVNLDGFLVSDDLENAPDLRCVFGTPDHCGSCGNKCPGPDNTGTARTCSDSTASATCNITCLADFYDVNADPSDGCEIEDALQNTAALAIPLTLADIATVTGGTCDSTNNGCTASRPIASDTREHAVAPMTRPLGLPDWWVVTAVGAGTSNHMTACLSISNFDWPTDNAYEICIAPTSGSMTPSICMTAAPRVGGVCVSPLGTPDSGTFYMTITKTAGSPTALGYALYLEH